MLLAIFYCDGIFGCYMQCKYAWNPFKKNLDVIYIYIYIYLYLSTNLNIYRMNYKGEWH
jgi:hypothetical protein